MEPEFSLPRSLVTIIPLKKRPIFAKCNDSYIISLIAHAAKIVARILRRRFEMKVEDVLGGDQCGFRRGKGNRMHLDAKNNRRTIFGHR